MMTVQHVNQCLQNWFQFPENKVFCQVSTIGDGQPHIRTMDLYQITAEGNIILLTETGTRKWKDLTHSPNIAICILKPDEGQIILEGSVALKTRSDDPVVDFSWHHCLDAYWRDYYSSRVPAGSSDAIPSSFGVMVVHPLVWEILEIDPKDFLKSTRKQYLLSGDSWETHEISPV